jgi:hypothetical protein
MTSKACAFVFNNNSLSLIPQVRLLYWELHQLRVCLVADTVETYTFHPEILNCNVIIKIIA